MNTHTPSSNALEALTPRQLEILGLVARGLSNADICRALEISHNTVKVHVAAIIRGLDVANRTEAATLYQRLQSESAAAALQLKVAERVGRPAIAVLPFQIMAESNPIPLAEGFAEDLITRLSSWRWFPVIAHASSRRFTSAELDLEALRSQLGVQYVITGSARHSSERGRINVHLIEAQQGKTLWSNAYDFDLTDTLRTQEEIAKRVVAYIAPELLEIEGRATIGPENFGAWESTMSGLWHLARRTEASVAKAESCFDSAIEQDPEFSLAWYGLAWVHHHAIVEQWSEDVDASLRSFTEAVAACKRLDPGSAATLLIVGLKELLVGDSVRATQTLEHAAEVNPSSAQALGLLGQCYCLGGKPDEAIALVEEALILNPLNPNAWAQKSVMALAHFAARRYDDALDLAAAALGDRPESITAHLVLAATFFEKGELQRAEEVATQLDRYRPNFDVDAYLKLIAPAALPEHIERIRAAFVQ